MRGSRKMKETEKRNKRDDDEVEQLLQAAQDQVLLNLSLNSHTTRAPVPQKNNDVLDLDLDLDLDLERRFQALKSSLPSENQEPKAVLGDDLSSRFAALKAKSSASVAAPVSKEVSLPPTEEEEEDDEDEEDQIEKLIQWAQDCARLDPSPPSDEDNDGD